MIDLDALNNIDPTPVAHKALNFLDQVSDHEKEVQGAALAITFLTYCRRHGADPGQFFTVGNNILASKHMESPVWWALHAYLEHET